MIRNKNLTEKQCMEMRRAHSLGYSISALSTLFGISSDRARRIAKFQARAPKYSLQYAIKN